MIAWDIPPLGPGSMVQVSLKYAYCLITGMNTANRKVRFNFVLKAGNGSISFLIMVGSSNGSLQNPTGAKFRSIEGIQACFHCKHIWGVYTDRQLLMPM